MTNEQLDQLLETIHALDVNEQEALFSGRDLPFDYLMESCKALNNDYLDQLVIELGNKSIFEATRLALTAATVRGILIGMTISDMQEMEDASDDQD